MVLHRVVHRLTPAATLLSFVFVGDCGGHALPAHSDRLTELQGQVVTEEQIAASGAHTAWEALRLTVHNMAFYESKRGVPTAIGHRGKSSIVLNDQPRIMLDAVTLTDFSVLAQIPASDLESIEVLSAMDATTYYGTNYPNGLIRIHTKTGS